MATFKIKGGNRLHGDLYPQGAKNEALQVICAVLLTPQKVTISNIPEISDVIKLIEILSQLGVKTERLSKGKYVSNKDVTAFVEVNNYKRVFPLIGLKYDKNLGLLKEKVPTMENKKLFI